MRNFIKLAMPVIILLSVMASACDTKKSGKEAGVYYTCPMHPEVKADEPGQCPICKMDLVKKDI